MSILLLRRGIIASSFRPPPPPFPLTLPGLEHWCDFSALGLADETPLASAGQKVPWTQGTAGARPTFRTGPNGIGGLPAAVFDGDDWMTLGVEEAGDTGLDTRVDAGYTVAVVWNGENGNLLCRADGATGSHHFRITVTGGSTASITFVINGSGNANVFTGVSRAPHLLVVTWDGETVRARLDGGSPATLTAGGGGTAGREITLGSYHDGNNPSAAGLKIGETIICSVGLEGDNASYMTGLNNYALPKWGIAA